MMCGRITFTFSKGELAAYLKEQYQMDGFKMNIDLPRYNVAPGQEIISIINDGSKNRVGLLKWGFIPSFAKDEKIGFKMINAKAETLFMKPAFREAALFKRCVILADSFYEWNKAKQPFRILTKGNHIFPLAGLFNTHVRANGDKVHTVLIITTNANKPMASIHERMPVILDKEAEEVWLNSREKDVEKLKKILKPFADDGLSIYPVSSYVNAVNHDDPACIEAYEDVNLFTDIEKKSS